MIFVRNTLLKRLGRTWNLLMLLCCLIPFSAHAQNVQLRGQVVDSEDGTPIEMVSVQIPDLGLWAVTDLKGNFHIDGLKPGRCILRFSTLGYDTRTDTLNLREKQAALKVKMDKLTLALDEVTVTAREKRSGSTSIIDATAIQHLQPKSIGDLLQLVPGNVTANPDLNAVGQAQVREIGSNSDNALGTALVVNGSPISNDANMQSISTAKQGTTINSYSEQGTSGRGTDLRILSPDNIESLEVIRGIPGVEYGNLTAGAVVIKTKKGYTPLEAKAKMDPNSKMFYLGKGLNLGTKGGKTNLSADYSDSYNDIRKRYNGYQRFTVNGTYSNVFLENWHPLSMQFDVSGFTTLNSVKNDPQLEEKERIKNENNGMRMSLEAKWNLGLKAITNLSLNTMFSYSHQKDYRLQKIILQSGVTPISDALTDGEYQSRYQQASYYSEYTIDGKPLDFYAQLKADKLLQYGESGYNKFLVGVEERYNKNKGDGMTFDPLFPPSVNDNQSIRPRPYYDVPALQQLTGFVEDKWHQPMGTLGLTIQAGARFTNLHVDETRALRGNINVIDPRLNAEFNLLNKQNNSFFDDLTLSGGYGITSKLPTMLYLYPDKAYFDATSLAALNNDVAMSIMTTKVVENTSNSELKATRNHKAEVTLSGSHKKMSFHLTAFLEQCDNDFGWAGVPVITSYRNYSLPQGVLSADYTGGQVWYTSAEGRQQAPYVMDTTFNTYQQPSNRIKTKKMGIEYSLNLGDIPFIATSVVVDGAYLWIKRRTAQDGYSVISTAYNGYYYPYMAVMPNGSGSLNERVNTNFRFITHLPKIKMVFSTTAQIIWMQKSQSIFESNRGEKKYYWEKNTQTGEDGRYYVDPVGYYDHAGRYYPWQEAYRQNGTYNIMRSVHTAVPDYFGCEKYPTTVLLNFRMTKELGKMMEISFLANNFLKLSKMHKNKTYNGYSELMIPLYFGAEIKLKI